MSDPQPLIRRRRIFVSNAGGVLGQAALRRAGPSRDLLAPHLGPGAKGSEPGALLFDLAETATLTTELKSCTTVIHLTERGDLDSIKRLVDAAVAARIEQFILVSASGSGRPIGDYLKFHARAEATLLASSLRYTIVRPSLANDGAGLTIGLATLLGRRTLRTMTTEDLALTLLDIAVHQSQLGAIIEGEELWKAVAEAQSHAARDFAAL